MSKRFVDTDLFRKPLMRSLQAPYKVLWVYLFCECDHAGIWDVELDVASMRLGTELDRAEVLKAFGGAIVEVDGGKKWWLPEFVAFQYGTLNPANKVHQSVIAILTKLNIYAEKEGAYKGLASSLQGAKDKDKDKDKEKEKERAHELTWPKWAGDRCRAKWSEFIAYRIAEHGKRYKTATSEQRQLDLAAKYFPNGRMFFEAIDYAMARQWQFPVDPAEHKYPFSDEAKPQEPVSTLKEYRL